MEATLVKLLQLWKHRKHIKRIQEETLRVLNAQITEATREYKIHCMSCKRQNRLRNWKYIQRHEYIPARGMRDSEWVKLHPEENDIVCPSCAHPNRIGRHSRSRVLIEILQGGEIAEESLFARVFHKFGEREPEAAEIFAI